MIKFIFILLIFFCWNCASLDELKYTPSSSKKRETKARETICVKSIVLLGSGSMNNGTNSRDYASELKYEPFIKSYLETAVEQELSMSNYLIDCSSSDTTQIGFVFRKLQIRMDAGARVSYLNFGSIEGKLDVRMIVYSDSKYYYKTYSKEETKIGIPVINFSVNSQLNSLLNTFFDHLIKDLEEIKKKR